MTLILHEVCEPACLRWVAATALAAIVLPPGAAASPLSGADKPMNAKADPVDAKVDDGYQTFYLNNISRQMDANDLQTAIRNMVPRAKVYYVEAQGALTVRGTAEDMQLVQRMVADLDRAKKTYRLTYTITETDGGKVAGTQHFSLILAAGGKSYFKQGNKVPIVTGKSTNEKAEESSQVQYLDVGLNVEANLEGLQDGVRLRTKVEESAVAEEKSGMGAQDPVIHQTTMEATSALSQGKPVVLGSLDMPGSTRHVEVAVVSEVLK